MRSVIKSAIIGFLIICLSCQERHKNLISVFLIDSTGQKPLNDIMITNNSSNLVAQKKDTNHYFLYAKPGDKIKVTGAIYKEVIFFVNRDSEQYNIVMEHKNHTR